MDNVNFRCHYFPAYVKVYGKISSQDFQIHLIRHVYRQKVVTNGTNKLGGGLKLKMMQSVKKGKHGNC